MRILFVADDAISKFFFRKDNAFIAVTNKGKELRGWMWIKKKKKKKKKKRKGKKEEKRREKSSQVKIN